MYKIGDGKMPELDEAGKYEVAKKHVDTLRSSRFGRAVTKFKENTEPERAVGKFEAALDSDGANTAEGVLGLASSAHDLYSDSSDIDSLRKESNEDYAAAKESDGGGALGHTINITKIIAQALFHVKGLYLKFKKAGPGSGFRELALTLPTTLSLLTNLVSSSMDAAGKIDRKDSDKVSAADSIVSAVGSAVEFGQSVYKTVNIHNVDASGQSDEIKGDVESKKKSLIAETILNGVDTLAQITKASLLGRAAFKRDNRSRKLALAGKAVGLLSTLIGGYKTGKDLHDSATAPESTDSPAAKMYAGLVEPDSYLGKVGDTTYPKDTSADLEAMAKKYESVDAYLAAIGVDLGELLNAGGRAGQKKVIVAAD